VAAPLVHRTAATVSFGKDGEDPHWETICGKRIGATEGMLLDGNPKHTTCTGCSGKRGNPRKVALVK
jgi:hypothetical protein